MPFPLDLKWIEEAERKIDYMLPIQYKESISTENGGSVLAHDETWDLYPIWDKSNKKRVKRTCNDIVHETEVCNDCYGFSEKGVTIASNGCGDQLIFIPSSDSKDELNPAVFMWNHETGKLIKVADNFGIIERYDS